MQVYDIYMDWRIMIRIGLIYTPFSLNQSNVRSRHQGYATQHLHVMVLGFSGYMVHKHCRIIERS